VAQALPDFEEATVMLQVKLKSPFTGTQSTASAAVLPDGRIQLDLYDFSDEAQSSMGHDVAWTWTVEVADKPRFVELLGTKAGAPISGDEALLEALARNFEHVHAVRAWMRENQIPFEENFDSSA
jgi:ribonuclease PH